MFLQEKDVTDRKLNGVLKLHSIAEERGQSLAQLAISWVLRDKRVNSALIGASRTSQIEENVKALEKTKFHEEELRVIDTILAEMKEG